MMRLVRSRSATAGGKHSGLRDHLREVKFEERIHLRTGHRSLARAFQFLPYAIQYSIHKMHRLGS